MPNWVTNKLEVTGNEDELRRFTEAVKSEGCEFDFNVIYPMPESLNVVSGSVQDDAIVAYLTDNCKKPLDDAMRVLFNIYGIANQFSDDWAARVYERIQKRLAEGTDDKVSLSPGVVKGEAELTLFDAGKIYCDNIDTHGAATWYDWCINSWGCKWPAQDVSADITDESAFYKFNTPWSTPVGIFKKLIEQFPTLGFEMRYADEDFGNNTGKICYLNGELKHCVPETLLAAQRFAAEVLDIDLESAESGFRFDEESQCYVYDWDE